jgi:hypothetical protein
MKGAVGFLIGTIGFTLVGALTVMVPFLMRPPDALGIVLFLVAVDFVFLNVLVVGFYRIMGHLHETILYPDDAYYHRHRGRAMFLTGYIGFLVTLVFFFLVILMEEVLRMRFGGELRPLVLVAWLAGWVFLGLLFGGVLSMLSDIFHKAFYRSAVRGPREEIDEDLNIARNRRTPREEERTTRRRDWEEP